MCVEGRDKVTKIIQYLAKFMAWYVRPHSVKEELNYLLFSEKIKESRQIFRLLKSLFEVKRIELIYKSNTDYFSRVTNITSRGFYLAYYLFDNIYIFGKCMSLHKILPFVKLEKVRRWARTCWLVGLALLLIYTCKTIRKTYTDESDLKVAALNKMTVR